MIFLFKHFIVKIKLILVLNFKKGLILGFQKNNYIIFNI